MQAFVLVWLSVSHTPPAAAPAFSTVTARRSLARPEPVARPSPHPAPPKKVEWPASVREYVQRSFAPENEIPGIGSQDLEKKLKEVITEAAENNKLLSVDWGKMLLPQQIIQQERRQTGPTAAPVPVEGHGFAEGINGSTPRKRKSPDTIMTDADDAAQPPWRKANSRNVFEDRITYPNQNQTGKTDKRQRRKQDNGLAKGSSKYQVDLEKRKQRFDSDQSGAQSTPPWASSRYESPVPDSNDGPVVGTCCNLEKNYFRLTSAPKPETVRPQPVLEQTLEFLKQKWRQESNYAYICDQFKSLRQDLTVQHIKNEFTVNVYEIHARIALEKGDLGEYNQCQTQLRALYSQKLGGHPAEFRAYRILYIIHTCNRTDMNDVLADLTVADKEQPAVKHALDVRSALALGNHHRFFRLYLETPNMGAYLIDMFITRERLAALANICKA